MTMPLSSSDSLGTRTVVVPEDEVTGFIEGVRGWLSETLIGCAAGAVHEATFVLTELLANAAKHAPGPYEVTVCRRALSVRIEVRDEAGPKGLPWEAGKGLLVVRGLCPQWGVTDHETAKTVWAELPILMMPTS